MTTQSSNSPLVGIITPVHNGADFLRQCIESVQAQTWQNWVYVILDNASTDGSGEIAAEFAARDSRIRVVRCDDLLPIIQNHNRAFDVLLQQVPEARYCKPLMADDRLFPTCIEQLVNAALFNPAIGLAACMGYDGEKALFFGLPYPSPHVPGRDIGRLALLQCVYVCGPPSSLLIRTDLIRKLRPFYTEDHMHADVEASFAMLREADLAFVHQVLTFNQADGAPTTGARHFDVREVCALSVLLRYGSSFLDAGELTQALNNAWYDYYRALALGALKRNDGEYWSYHHRWLHSHGYQLDKLRLRRAVVVEGVRNLVHRTFRSMLWPWLVR